MSDLADALREGMYMALLNAKVNGSPVHEHLDDLLDAAVPDTLAALPEGTHLFTVDSLAAALHTDVLGCRWTEAQEYNACPGPSCHEGDAAVIIALAKAQSSPPNATGGRDE